MKFLYKGILIASLALCVTSVTAFATEISEKENISFNYQENTFGIETETTLAEQELTVMLLKGDYSENSDLSLGDISTSDVYYIGQERGTEYDVFENLGVKYVSNEFTPGVYTLITCGETAAMTKTKLVIGNALGSNAAGEYLPDDMNASDYTFGSVSKTVRYYPEGVGKNYIYVCYADFPNITNLDDAGFVFQNISETSIKHLYKPLSQFKLNDALKGINSYNTLIQIGVQINNVPATGENAVKNIVAIPYVKKQVIGG